MAFDIPRGRVLPVDAVDIRLDPGPHPFAVANRDAAAKNWERERAQNPTLHDGEIILLAELAYRDGLLVGRCHMTRYATFLYWRRNRDLSSAEHAFAYAALVSADNALVAIRMGAQTANPGKVYFAAGSFEPPDFRDGQVDIEANTVREVREETGIDISGAPHDQAYNLYSLESGTVIFRRYRLAETAEALARRIRAFVAAEPEPEIEGPVIIRSVADMPDAVAPHMDAIVRWHFSGAGG